MAGQRTIAPSPARLRRAWQAGVRPSARWLLPGAVCIVLASSLAHVRPDLQAVIDPLRVQLASPRRPDLGPLSPLVADAMLWGIGALVATLALGWLIRLVSGDAGPVDTGLRRRLKISSMRVSGLLWTLLALGLSLLAFAALVPVLAGAARAADADQASLVQLWRLWSLRVLWTMGGLLVLAGFVELVVGRRRRWRALHLSFEEALLERRAFGGRRG